MHARCILDAMINEIVQDVLETFLRIKLQENNCAEKIFTASFSFDTIFENIL